MRRGKAVSVVAAVAALMPWSGWAAWSAEPAAAPAVAPPPTTQPATMPPDPVDLFMGDYEGTMAIPGTTRTRLEAKVIAEGKGAYRVVMEFPLDDSRFESVELKGKLENGKVPLTAVGEWAGEIGRVGLVMRTLTGDPAFAAVLKRVVRGSPTEGARPPDGAVVLLPYEPGKPTNLDEWTNKNWKVLPDGSVEVFRGNNRTVRRFGDCRLHVEFRIPYMPDARGQGRGNSGVYLQNRYEVQVLDSFGLPTRDNECGGIYRVSTPKVNASLPPLSWQTFDITFRAPRLDADGKLVEPAVISVEHNGELIHDKVQLKTQTGGGASGAAARDVIMLQDHGNPVRYRNIWLVELADETAGPPAAPATQPDVGTLLDLPPADLAPRATLPILIDVRGSMAAPDGRPTSGSGLTLEEALKRVGGTQPEIQVYRLGMGDDRVGSDIDAARAAGLVWLAEQMGDTVEPPPGPPTTQPEVAAPATQPDTAATTQPDAGGFRDLFNGTDLAGWTLREGSWVVEEGGVLARGAKGGGYAWTVEQFGDFVLDLEFKIAKGSNSGVFFRTASTRDPVQTGIELQIYDTVGKAPTRNSCGAIYDCLAPSRNVERPVGEWNRVVLTCRGPKITVVMNGEQIIDMDLDRWTEPRRNPDGTANKFRTAYKDMPRRGHIGFQDHGNPVWFRNIRIKALE